MYLVGINLQKLPKKLQKSTMSRRIISLTIPEPKGSIMLMPIGKTLGYRNYSAFLIFYLSIFLTEIG